MTPGYRTYHRTQIATADKRRIIVLLYEGAISRLNQAIRAMTGDKANGKTVNVNKALDIIHFLNNSLDFEQGGEIADNLARLYDYTRDIVTAGSITNDPERLREAVRLLTTLLEGWRAICDTKDSTLASIGPQVDQATRSIATVG